MLRFLTPALAPWTTARDSGFRALGFGHQGTFCQMFFGLPFRVYGSGPQVLTLTETPKHSRRASDWTGNIGALIIRIGLWGIL